MPPSFTDFLKTLLTFSGVTETMIVEMTRMKEIALVSNVKMKSV